MSPSSSPIEKHLEIIPASNSGHSTFHNSHPLWRPGARGIFGGIAIGQSLRAAQMTVPETFVAHSMHCSFIHAGNAEDRIMYNVESFRDGRSFCTRLVRAAQGDRSIFLAMISFTRRATSTSAYLEHATAMPEAVHETEQNAPGPAELRNISPDTPYINRSVGVLNTPSQSPQDKRIHQWIRARGILSRPAGDSLHLAALAFMSDSYFLAAVPHSHGIWRFVQAPVSEFYPTSADLSGPSRTHTAIRRPHFESASDSDSDEDPRVAMMVSLDHTIYFHNVDKLRTDEWLLAEVHSSWAGEGRGLIHQKMWTRDGTLVATCIQEVS